MADRAEKTKIACPLCNRRLDGSTVRVWGDYVKGAFNGHQRISLDELSAELDLPPNLIAEVVKYTGIATVDGEDVLPKSTGF